MLLWTSSKEALQTLEFFYGTYMATEVAYYTYIYAKVDKVYYPKVSSHTRAAMLLGKLVASITSQLLIYYEAMDYKELHYLSFAFQIAATLWAFFLPSVKNSVYFHRGKSTVDEEGETTTKLSGLSLIWHHFKNSYSNPKVVQWSIWYAVGVCGMYQVFTYIQILWKAIEPEPDVAWNAGVDAAHTFIGAIFALMAGYLHTGRMSSTGSLLLLAVLSILEGGAVLMSVMPHNLYASYAGFIIFGSLYAFTITIASAEVARFLEEDSFGLVFGFNTFVALILQTVMNIIILDGAVLTLGIEEQYMVYAFYFIVIGIIYLVFAILEYFNFFKSNKVLVE
ncbi:SLC19A2.2 family protein [Megaselia abdita]